MKNTEMKITSVADFKRRMQVGSRWHAYNHSLNADMGERECTKVQTNAFAFKFEPGPKVGKESWCNFPKAAFCGFDGASVVIFDSQSKEQPVLTYTLRETA